MKLKIGKKIYFASDNHLGAPNRIESLKREKIFVNWLEDVRKDADQIFILGDLFDFWFEYSKVVPKGFVRVLGKLAEISDSGIKINFFVGNHDLWVRNYFEEELGINVYRKPEEFNFNNFIFYIGHGDGLGPKDKGYKLLKFFFTNPIMHFFFRLIHPDIGIKLGQYFSQRNKLISGDEDVEFLGEEKEWLIQYCKKKLNQKNRDFFIFGHRHLPLNIDLNNKAKYINLGDWITHYSYAVFDGKKLELKVYDYRKL